MLSPLEPVPGAAQLKPNVRKTLDTSERWLFVQNWASISSGLVRLRIDSAGVPSDGRQSHHGVGVTTGVGLVVITVDVEVGLGV